MNLPWTIFVVTTLTIGHAVHIETGDKLSAWVIYFLACFAVLGMWAIDRRNKHYTEYLERKCERQHIELCNMEEVTE